MPSSSLSPQLQNWLERGQAVNLSGHQIFTIDEGSPDLPVVLLVHGFPTSSWDFQKIWAALAEKHRLVSLDMLGFGFSDKPDKRDYTIHKQADLFVELLQRLDIREFDMLAHDYGVSVAQELLARQRDAELPSRCKSCAFLNGGLFPETHHALFVQKLLLSPVGKYANRLLGYPMFKKSFSKVFGEQSKPSEAELKEFWSVINFKHGRHLFHNLITYIIDRRTHRERWLKPLQDSDIPLAVLNGSVDPVSGAHLVTRYQELQCRLDYLKQFPALGHYPQCENPEAVATAYLEFLATCAS